MGLSGNIAGGVSDALEQVLARRLQEEIRRHNEEQQKADLQLRQQAQASLDEDRRAGRAFQQGQLERQDAQALYGRTEPGAITPDTATTLRRDPGLAPLVTSRKVLDARPINAAAVLPDVSGGSTGGVVTPTTDTSAPQNFDVLEPTPQQAKAQKRVVDLRRITGELANAGGEDARRRIAATALGDEIQLPESMIGPTVSERDASAAKKLADQRAYEEREWTRRNTITNAQMNARSSAKTAGQVDASGAYTAERARRTVQSVDSLIDRVGPWTVGRGALLSYIPETDAADFEADLNTLKANIAFGELSAMRAASKTGGALGAVSERELALLESTLGALSTKQSAANFKRNLQQIKDSINRWEAERRRLGGAETPPFAGPIDERGQGTDEAIEARVEALLRGVG